jgi:hypothetical protein
MSSDEYEYDTPSDSDEEPAGYEMIWHALCKRIHFKEDGIHITLLTDDCLSILDTILSYIEPGINRQSTTYNFHIESLHNAIVNNPTRNKGVGRLVEMKRLCKLRDNDTTPTLYIKDVVSLWIQDAREIKEFKGFKHLHHLRLDHPSPSISFHFPITHLEVRHAERCPKLNNILPQQLTLKHIDSFSRYFETMHIHVHTSVISEHMIYLMRERLQLDETVSVKQASGEIKPYNDWKSTFKINI